MDANKPIKILIVDDERNIREALKLALSWQGVFSIREAVSGKDALKEVAIDKPDIILLDFEMPVMNGPETYKILKSDPETKSIPVIFVTARPYDDIAREIPIGVNEYIEKPWDIKELYTKIMSVIT